MALASKFQGFSPKAVEFFGQLASHNSRAWFEEHKAFYEEQVLAPARSLVEDLGQALAKAAPGLHAEPKVNRSLFRIQRDTRFSADKTPYKTHLGIWLWEGEGPRMECPGFYFHLEPTNAMVAGGMYMFPKRLLPHYRQAVAGEKTGAALAKSLATIARRGAYTLGGLHYARLPKGFAPDHPRAALLRHDRLYLFQETPLPAELHSPALVDWCATRFREMLPLHRWLLEFVRRVGWEDRGDGLREMPNLI
jgi:uncharacterized protein (TIGR02453 family)